MLPADMTQVTLICVASGKLHDLTLDINAYLTATYMPSGTGRPRCCYLMLPPGEGTRSFGVDGMSSHATDLHENLALYTDTVECAEGLIHQFGANYGPLDVSFSPTMELTRMAISKVACSTAVSSFMNNRVGLEMLVSPCDETSAFTFGVDWHLKRLDVRLESDPAERDGVMPADFPPTQILSMVHQSVLQFSALGLDGRSPLANLNVMLTACGWASYDAWPLRQRIAVHRSVRKCLGQAVAEAGLHAR